jgi:hypothetical protein
MAEPITAGGVAGPERVMMDAMGLLSPLRTSFLGRRAKTIGLASVVSIPLLAVSFIACAVGSSADPELGDRDAAALEASSQGIPRDGSQTDADDPEPDPETDGGDADSGPQVSPACTSALAAATWNFDSGDQGWTHVISDGAGSGPTWPYDPWSRGTASTIPCPAGSCWAAERTTNYAQCQRGELVSPRVDLTACAGETVTLVFTHAYAFWTGTYGSQSWSDGGIVEISSDNGSSWQLATATFPGTVRINPNRGSSYKCHAENSFHAHNKAGFTGQKTTPSAFEITIPANYLTANLRVRFSQASGVSSDTTNANTSRGSTAAGWRIDDVHFTVK